MFNQIPADILGQVYEQFLGKVIRLESGHRAVVEDKPEVKKAGGVYYTPTYIVEYIVEQTVGKLLRGKTPGQVHGTAKNATPLRILDPACGSGSFLIGTYQYLLDWYRAWYTANNPHKHRDAVYQSESGAWWLTLQERKRILLDHVFGVDIDTQAVEVTKLSLLLKVLEGETEETLGSYRRLVQQRALPSLEHNIKCGNSLIGSDFYAQQALPDMDEQLRVNVFDWDGPDGFPAIMRAGGFDAVIGNPPYINVRVLTQVQGDEVKQYFQRKYACADRGYDIYVLFVEQAMQLLRSRGRFGMIIPNKIAALDYAYQCRLLLLTNTEINNVVDVSKLNVFPSASVYPYVIISEKVTPDSNYVVQILHATSPTDLALGQNTLERVQRSFSAKAGLTIHGSFNVEERVLTKQLSERARLHSGTTGFAAQQMAGLLVEEQAIEGEEHFDFVVSGNIDRFALKLGNVRFMNRLFQKPVLPTKGSSLTANKLALYRDRKVIFAGMTKRLEATYDSGGLALSVQVYAAAELLDDHRYLLGILNSALLSYLFRLRFEAKHLAGGFLAINKGQLNQLPIRTIDFAKPADRQRHDDMVRLVERMLALHTQRTAAKTAQERTVIERQIAGTDREIDRLVYALYDLTADEIVIVEGATG